MISLVLAVVSGVGFLIGLICGIKLMSAQLQTEREWARHDNEHREQSQERLWMKEYWWNDGQPPQGY